MKPIILELPADGRVHYRAVITPGNPVTICEIQKQAEPIQERYWEVKHYGISICRHGDAYDFETGCRLSLKSALRKPKAYDYTDKQSFREAAWKAYLDRFPPSQRKRPEPPKDLCVTVAKAFEKALIEDGARYGVYQSRLAQWPDGRKSYLGY